MPYFPDTETIDGPAVITIMHIVHLFLRLTKISVHRVKACVLPGRGNRRHDDDQRQGESSPLMASEVGRRSGAAGGTSITSEYRGFEQSWDAVRIFALHATIYYASAVLGFSFLIERLSIIDSLYLASCTFTTIG